MLRRTATSYLDKVDNGLSGFVQFTKSRSYLSESDDLELYEISTRQHEIVVPKCFSNEECSGCAAVKYPNIEVEILPYHCNDWKKLQLTCPQTLNR